MGRRDRSAKRRDVEARLAAEGWIVARVGPGDHVQYRHPEKVGRVTIDRGSREFPTGTLRSIYRQAGWEW
jgi:predicted RNA binding protein YcfA (HicA-like mRNA interferase family)